MKFLIPIVWAVAMLASRFIDPLIPIFTAAMVMTVIVVWGDHRLMRTLLRITPRIAMLSVGAAIAMVAVTYLAFPLLASSIPMIAAETRSIYAHFLARRSLLPVIALVVPVVIAEELLWRGEVQQGMRRWSVFGAAAIYAIAHAPSGSLLLVVVAFVCGLYWSALREISGSLVPPLCAHLVWDIALLIYPLVR